jgi:hypothetical protein
MAPMIEEHRRRIAIVGSGVLGSQYGAPGEGGGD